MGPSFLQSESWEGLRKAQGWLTFRFDGYLVLQKKLPLGMSFLIPSGMSFLYCPEAPAEILKSTALAQIDDLARKNWAIFSKIELLAEDKGGQLATQLKKFGYQKSFEDLQPASRQWVDIALTEDKILAQMKSKGRYNIKVAQRHGVKVEMTQKDKGLADFYSMMQETSRREHFTSRSLEYFRALLTHTETRLLVARWQDQILAGMIAVIYKDWLLYLYGVSSSEHRNLMAPYLLHWEAIKMGKAADCKTYDLLAIAPDDNPKHKWAGLRRFKEQFGGRQVDLIGAYDKIYHPVCYQAFKQIERLRRGL